LLYDGKTREKEVERQLDIFVNGEAEPDKSHHTISDIEASNELKMGRFHSFNR